MMISDPLANHGEVAGFVVNTLLLIVASNAFRKRSGTPASHFSAGASSVMA
jgi:hypothetical protein